MADLTARHTRMNTGGLKRQVKLKIEGHRSPFTETAPL
jgi:hypothetical protein